jgi:hypothetical protein
VPDPVYFFFAVFGLVVALGLVFAFALDFVFALATGPRARGLAELGDDIRAAAFNTSSGGAGSPAIATMRA